LKITAVVEHDRQSLKNYLTGIIDTCPQIDQQMIINYNNDNNNSNNNNYNNSEFSKEKLNEQRVKNARILDKITNSSRSHNNNNINTDDDNREDTTVTTTINALNKRKIQETILDVESSQQDPDYQQFLEEDRQILSRFRVDDIPVKTISTVLNTVGTVSCISRYMYICMYVWMDRCIYVCMYVCVYVFMHVWLYVWL